MIGLDARIEELKDLFTTKLFTDVANNTYTSYGRAYWLKRKDEQTGVVFDVPELLISATQKYQDVLPNHKIHGHSFFIADTGIDIGGYLISKVSIYFAINLDVLYPNVTERAVEYLHKDVIKVINMSLFKLIHIETDLPAFERFGFVKETDNMQPYYLVRFDTKIEYIIKC